MYPIFIVLAIQFLTECSQSQVLTNSESVSDLMDGVVVESAAATEDLNPQLIQTIDDDEKEPIRGFDPIRHTIFKLFTMPNNVRGEVVRLGNKDLLEKSAFNTSNPTRFIIHDWDNEAESPVNFLIKNAYLEKSDYNIFIVDWSLGSKGLYAAVRQRSIRVGRVLGEFIDFLHNEGGVDLGQLYLVGYGLGAHIAGIAGKTVTTGKIGVIYALNPVVLRFGPLNAATILSRDDAAYVEVIHTSVLASMLQRPVGHADFYVSYGSTQPGCGLNLMSCSHERSYKYFAESITTKRGFYGIPCTNVRAVIARRTCRRARQPIALMGGEFAQSSNSGVYYVPVGAFPPYARGRVEIAQ